MVLRDTSSTDATSSAGARLDGVSKSYGRMKVVDRVSLEIAPGEIMALLGPSGCGKTTTLRMIAGLVAPDEGRISIGGEEVTDVPAEKRDIGLLFQNYALFPHLTVLGNVMFGLRTWRRGTPKAEARKMALDALRQVRLEEYEDRYPAALSGGQQQRVALARALVTNPRVLLLDEPLSALDKNLRTAMQIEIRALVTRLGLTTVLVTHDQEEAMTVADRIAVMDHGKLVQVGTAADLYERPQTRFVADFVGTANFFSGEIERDDKGRAVLVTAGGARLTVPDADTAPCRQATIAVRPERIRIGKGKPGGTNAISGTVESVAYKGTTVSVALRAPDGMLLQLVLLNTGASGTIACDGKVVTASWDEDANVLMKEEQT